MMAKKAYASIPWSMPLFSAARAKIVSVLMREYVTGRATNSVWPVTPIYFSLTTALILPLPIFN